MWKLWVLVAVISFLGAPSQAARDASCGTNQTKVIEARAQCVDKGGISIGAESEGDPRLACLESKTVQSRCGQDGSLARLRAFQRWLKQVKEFEALCSSGGGSFSYEDPHFVEPSNESYCRQAVPRASSNMFEETLCNFESACPPVKVSCEHACSETPVASLF